MEKQETIVTVERNGKIVYRGPEQRRGESYVTVDAKIPFGLSIRDVAWLLTIVILAVLFVQKIDSRITKGEETQKILVESVGLMSKFMQNSDLWHTEVTGKTFSGGQPTAYINTQRAREIFGNDRKPN